MLRNQFTRCRAISVSPRLLPQLRMRIQLLVTHLLKRHRPSRQRIQQTSKSNIPLTHDPKQRHHITLLGIFTTSIFRP